MRPSLDWTEVDKLLLAKELSYPEIAVMFGIPQGTVRAHVYKKVPMAMGRVKADGTKLRGEQKTIQKHGATHRTEQVIRESIRRKIKEYGEGWMRGPAGRDWLRSITL